ncbi:hypothetical protein [Streptomyces sp. MZ04]|uniref:hypothetical protein n=1 Tax=Streptomyces sp. MZ04 TaxID=2559236 RepID=UPI00107E651C|nr:hypothetical protein [Streptomyces sp. MZ04]TGB09780.1 hypothetical protein E2651_15635 [Streptomyces sp. MZ04]
MTPDQIRESYARQVEKIRAREDLTDQARQVAMARAHKAAATRLQAARDADRQRYEERRTQLEKRLFGNKELTGTDALSARDARERAAQLGDPREAQAAYNRAQRDGDRDMQRAIASHAADLAAMPILGDAWAPLVETHAAATPGYAENLTELRTLAEPGGFMDATYASPDVPSELGRMSVQQVNSLADSELSVYGHDAPEAA